MGNGPAEILPFLQSYRKASFGKTGFVATRDFIIRKGVLSMFSFCQEVQLKKLGLPVLLKRGKLLLNQDYVVCEKGQPLRPEQSKLLELLGVKMAEFTMTIYAHWTGDEFNDCLDEFRKSNDSASSAESDDEQKDTSKESDGDEAAFLMDSDSD